MVGTQRHRPIDVGGDVIEALAGNGENQIEVELRESRRPRLFDRSHSLFGAVDAAEELQSCWD